MEIMKPVVFKINSNDYGISIEYVSGIEKAKSISVEAGLPENVKGLLSIRNQLLPVYNMRKKLGLAEKNVAEPTVIIVKTSELMMALEVDSVEEINDLDGAAIKELPEMLQNDNTTYVDKIINKGGRMIVLVDVNNIATKEELEQIKKVIKEVSERTE